MKRDNSGAIFRNKKKEKDTHPDRTGQCVVNGVEYWISGWMEEHDGEPYMSIKFKPKDENGGKKETKSERDSW